MKGQRRRRVCGIRSRAYYTRMYEREEDKNSDNGGEGYQGDGEALSECIFDVRKSLFYCVSRWCA